MNKVMVGVLVASLWGGVGMLGAQESVDIQGEIIDPGLYLREGLHGPEVENRMYDAVDGGQSLAILEDGTERVYLLLAGSPGEDPNELVYDFVGRRVRVSGAMHQRDGVKGVVAATVEPLEATTSPDTGLPEAE